MIDTTNINDRQIVDLLWDIIENINTLDTELSRVKTETRILIKRLSEIEGKKNES